MTIPVVHTDRSASMPYAVIAAVFLSCYLTWRPSQDIMFTLSDALFVIGAAQLAFTHRLPLQPLALFTSFWIAGFAMLIVGLLLGSLACPTPSRWLIVSIQYLFAWIVLPMIVLDRSEGAITTMLKAFVWGVVAMNLFGAVVYYTYTGTFEEARDLFGLDFLSGGRRLGAFASDANWNGAVLAMALPSILYLRAKRRVGGAVTLLWIGVVLQGVMLCASFTAFSSCVVAIILFAVVGGVRPSSATVVRIGAVAAVALLVLVPTGSITLPAIFVERVGNAVSNGDIAEAGTFEGRMALVREAWTLVDQHLVIGAGADQYRVVSQYGAPVHNMYLLLWVEGGLLSVLGWIVMMLVLLGAAMLAFSRDRIAAAMTLSVTTTFLLASTASPHMYARLWAVPVFLALAVSLRALRDPIAAVARPRNWGAYAAA